MNWKTFGSASEAADFRAAVDGLMGLPKSTAGDKGGTVQTNRYAMVRVHPDGDEWAYPITDDVVALDGQTWNGYTIDVSGAAALGAAWDPATLDPAL